MALGVVILKIGISLSSTMHGVLVTNIILCPESYFPFLKTNLSVGLGLEIHLGGWIQSTFSGVDGKDEDLFQFHQKNLDKKRDREWEADRESRIFQLEEIMRMRDSNETEVSEEQVGEGNDEDPFVPEIEIPSMINTFPSAPDSNAEPDPFAPMDLHLWRVLLRNHLLLLCPRSHDWKDFHSIQCIGNRSLDLLLNLFERQNYGV